MQPVAEIVWNAGTIAVVLIFSVPIFSIIGAFWYKLERAKSDNDLKRSMIERGMSPADIERVLAAKSAEHDDD